MTVKDVDGVENPAMYWGMLAEEWIQVLQVATSLLEIQEKLVQVLPWQFVVFYAVHEEQNRLVAVTSKGYEQGALETLDMVLNPGQSVVAHSYNDQAVISIRSSAELDMYEVDDHCKRMWQRSGAQALIAVPLIHRGRVVGIIQVAVSDELSLPGIAVRTLDAVGPKLAALISKQAMLEIVEKENEALRWMQNMSRILLFVNTEQELWRQFRDMLIQIGQVHGGTYVVYDQNEWHVEEVFGVLAHYSAKIRATIVPWIEERYPVNWRENRIHWTPPGTRVLPDYIPDEPSTSRGMLYYVGDDKQLYAVMTLYVPAPTPLMDRLLPSLLEMYSLAFQIIRQRKALENLRDHDPLTGLSNRRALETHMEAYFSLKHSMPAIMVLFDLDGFKNLNDTHGHQTGDEALRRTAQYFQSCAQNQDLVARLGGDEFVMILHGTIWGPELVDEICSLVHKSPLAEFGLSVTMGVVSLPFEGTDFATCYRIADERLYKGKRMGKSRIVGPNGSRSIAPISNPFDE